MSDNKRKGGTQKLREKNKNYLRIRLSHAKKKGYTRANMGISQQTNQ